MMMACVCISVYCIIGYSDDPYVCVCVCVCVCVIIGYSDDPYMCVCVCVCVCVCMRAPPTGHAVEEPPAGAVVGLQVLAVGGPVHVCDTAGGAQALAHLLVALHHAVHVHRVLIGSHRHILANDSPAATVLCLSVSLRPDWSLTCHSLLVRGNCRPMTTLPSTLLSTYSPPRSTMATSCLIPAPGHLCVCQQEATVPSPSCFCEI